MEISDDDLTLDDSIHTVIEKGYDAVYNENKFKESTKQEYNLGETAPDWCHPDYIKALPPKKGVRTIQ